MKKKVLLPILVAVLLLAILFIPIPKSPCKDGGTREYCALTYKIVDWNRLSAYDTYSATRVYWFPDNFKSVDDLWAEEEPKVVHSLIATVLEVNGNTVFVQPVIGEEARYSFYKISFNATNPEEIVIGSNLEISYTGGIMETYPAQINAIEWTPVANLRHREYTDQWLKQKTAVDPKREPDSEIIITQIYANCFFAEPIIPSLDRIKVNCQLSEEWCVGDRVSCTYKNAYSGQDFRYETDLVTIKPSDYKPDPGSIAYKPVIYLYPEKETEVSVKLQLDGKLTCTYPAYNTGWKVTAAPDGTLTDANGQSYNYLYWEGETAATWDLDKGFCVKGEDTAEFLEETLAKLGLNRKEANEFIVYWLPLMEQNPYNIISFQTDTYTDVAQLQITPTPDTLIRVFMAWRAADAFTELTAQELTAPERTGFTVVEWGGTQLP